MESETRGPTVEDLRTFVRVCVCVCVCAHTCVGTTRYPPVPE